LCGVCFSVDHHKKLPPLWIPHLDGLPFRKLANEYFLSPIAAYRQVEAELNLLPPNEWITGKFCRRFSGILNVDGKFIKVRGYPKKIPFIYAIDYLTHDIVVGVLALGESYEAYRKLFQLLKEVGYQPKIVVSDEAPALPLALNRVWPRVFQQLCHTHYLENLRLSLLIRTKATYRDFFGEIEKIFQPGLSWQHRFFVLQALREKYAHDLNLVNQLDDLIDKYPLLFAFENVSGCPRSNNIIEAFNSHLNGRLKTIKGFESFAGAERWLNGWMIRRRTKPFTDCEGQFRSLNGKCSLEGTIDEKLKFEEVYEKICGNLIKIQKKKS
jgi:transposase-like protein